MRHYFAIFGALFMLAACATPTLDPGMQLRLNEIAGAAQPITTSPNAFTVIDQRDPVALRARYAPVGIAGGFSCNAGVEQLGDVRHAADRIARLEAALATAFPSATSSGELIVRRYDIYLNHTAETNSEAVSVGFGGGLLAEAIAPTPNSQSVRITRVARCGRDRMTHGWFDPADLSNNFPPITIDIDVTVFGQQHVINAAHSPTVDFYRLNYTFGLESDYPEARAALEATLQLAMAKAEARLVESVMSTNPTTTNLPTAP